MTLIMILIVATIHLCEDMIDINLIFVHAMISRRLSNCPSRPKPTTAHLRFPRFVGVACGCPKKRQQPGDTSNRSWSTRKPKRRITHLPILQAVLKAQKTKLFDQFLADRKCKKKVSFRKSHRFSSKKIQGRLRQTERRHGSLRIELLGASRLASDGVRERTFATWPFRGPKTQVDNTSTSQFGCCFEG